MKKFIKRLSYLCSKKSTRKDWSLYKREFHFLKQRYKRGFSDDETWSLYNTFSEYIAPRLIRYREIDSGVPGYYSSDEWHNRLDTMIYAFNLINGDLEPYEWSNEEHKKCEEGLKMFSEDFLTLWW